MSGQLPVCPHSQHQTSQRLIWDNDDPSVVFNPTDPPTRDAMQSPVSKGIFMMNTKPARGDNMIKSDPS